MAEAVGGLFVMMRHVVLVPQSHHPLPVAREETQPLALSLRENPKEQASPAASAIPENTNTGRRRLMLINQARPEPTAEVNHQGRAAHAIHQSAVFFLAFPSYDFPPPPSGVR